MTDERIALNRIAGFGELCMAVEWIAGNVNAACHGGDGQALVGRVTLIFHVDAGVEADRCFTAAVV